MVTMFTKHAKAMTERIAARTRGATAQQLFKYHLWVSCSVLCKSRSCPSKGNGGYHPARRCPGQPQHQLFCFTVKFRNLQRQLWEKWHFSHVNLVHAFFCFFSVFSTGTWMLVVQAVFLHTSIWGESSCHM